MDDLLTAQLLMDAEVAQKNDEAPKFSLVFERKFGLQRTGDINPDTLIKFFARCNEMYDRPDVMEALKTMADRRRDIESAINALQKKLFAEEFNVDPEHGLEFLGKITSKHKDNPKVMIPFQHFVSREELAMDQIEGVPEEQVGMKRAMLDRINAMNMELLEKVKDLSAEEARRVFKEHEERQNSALQDQQKAMQAQMVQMLAKMRPQQRIEFVQQQVMSAPMEQRNVMIEQFKMMLFLAEQEAQKMGPGAAGGAGTSK